MKQYAWPRLAVAATPLRSRAGCAPARRAAPGAGGRADGCGPRDPRAAASAPRARWSAAGGRMFSLRNRRRRPRVAVTAPPKHGVQSDAA
jgi:hypothetical protein